MKKLATIALSLLALSTTACGGGASKSSACGCTSGTNKDACEAVWEGCDSQSGSNAKDCKNALKDLYCK